ncbi:Two-component response regulator-like PRR95 [Apostasia shenzhenica]|uniref:Two-component response regulator-like PRR95 n=1 Tax=Apostasia shenzhenica TaxID=1088818 RepID=A0A2H9ZS71_9ASPA|nr:Two-component response regulator-like PRR95 [Apostasia shenzhenica]
MGMGEEVKEMGLEREMELEEEEEEGARWEKLLTRIPVRVLLVERDDSTRHIIGALLRKCGYRVGAACDGLAAWEILKEKGHQIDLILTEVELPKMSGVDLLTVIMDHQVLKNIPVIMMSSHDSISIVYKCMMKGASDFLVKPIRKNELGNLWQHVWRKRKLNDDDTGSHEHHGENFGAQKQKLDVESGYCSNENATLKQNDNDCYEKESDAQSSCTRSDMEVESMYTQENKVELVNSRQHGFFLFDKMVNHGNQAIVQLDKVSVLPNDVRKGERLVNDETNPTGKSNGEGQNKEEYSTEGLDLIGVINNQSRDISSSDVNSANNLLGFVASKTSMPSLELSLKRCQHSICNWQDNEESNALHHSNSSAFSLYNNSITIEPRVSKPASFQTQNLGNSSGFVELSPDQFPPNNLESHELISNPEVAKSPATSSSVRAVRCTPIRLIPIAVPIGVMNSNSTEYNPMLQPMFYHQSALSLWPSMWQEALTGDPSHLSGSKDLSSEGYLPKNQRQEESAEMRCEGRNLSATMSNDERFGVNGPPTTGNITEVGERIGNEAAFNVYDGSKPIDTQRLSVREAALAKFRLKRKGRCYEKKVRYISRKKLAEQRPRVKGQFVRHVQSQLPSVGIDINH